MCDLKKKKHIKYLGIALLMLYVFGLAPSVMFLHHHHHDIVDFSCANSCEKAIYFGIHDEHEAHFTKADDKCWLCDNHTVTPQTLIDIAFNLPQFEYYSEYIPYCAQFLSADLIGNSNKDPPLFA